MKKLLLLLPIFILCLSQRKVTEFDTDEKLRYVSVSDIDLEKSEKENRVFLKGENKPFNGILTHQRLEDYQSNDLFSVERYRVIDGYNIGWQRSSDSDGHRLFESWEYKSKEHGVSRSWWSSLGQPKIEVYTIRGKLEGPSRTFYESGLPSFIGNHKDDNLYGMITWFHENGMPKESGLWLDQKRYGFHIKWDEEGKVTSQKYYYENKEVSEDEWLALKEKEYKEFYNLK